MATKAQIVKVDGKKCYMIDGHPVPANKTGGISESKGFRAFIYTLMSVIGVILIVPFVMMVLQSFMPYQDMVGGFRFFPSSFTGDNYLAFLGADIKIGGVVDNPFKPIEGLEAWEYVTVLGALGNTAIVAVFNLIAVPLSATFVAYGFARCKFIGKNALFAFMLSTMMLPTIVTIVPLYGFYNSLKWTGTFLPLTLPNITGGGAMYIFLARSFIQSLPKEIDNAAKIDGAGALRRYFSITLPLCKPIIIYIMIGVFNTAWGDFYGPSVWNGNKSPGFQTLALFVYNQLNNIDSPGMQGIFFAAGTILSTVPLVLFFFFQKQLIEGVAMDGLKG